MTVPTSLSLYVSETGDVITPTNFSVSDTGSTPIGISSINVTSRNGYTLSDYSLNTGRADVSSRLFALKLDGCAVSKSGEADLSGIPFLDGGDTHAIDVKALSSMPGRAVNNEIIADIMFTVSWQSGRLYSISLTRMPNKTLYFEGENFSSAGMEIRALYFGKESEIINTYSVVDGTALKYGTSYVTVLVSKDGCEKTCQVPVKVNRILSSIEITAPPSVTSYSHGDTFKPSGMIVTAIYSDGTRKAVTNYSVNPAVLSYSNKTVTVTYVENGVSKSASLKLDVKRVLSSVKMDTPPYKTSYIEGEKADLNGMKIRSYYTDGGYEDIDTYSYSPLSLSINDRKITVTARGREIDIPVTVKAREIAATPSPVPSSGPVPTPTPSPSPAPTPTPEIRNIGSAACTASLECTEYTYSNSPFTPKVSVYYSGSALKEGTDFVVSYSDNVCAGNAKAVISGKGKYTGEKILSFEIRRKGLSVTWSKERYLTINEYQHPVPVLSGVIEGDSCEAVLDGKGGIGPGSYTCRIVSLTNANYEITKGDTSCSYTIEKTGMPLLASGSIGDKLIYAGFKKTDGEFRIRNVIFTPCYMPTGSETHSLVLDSLSEGSIRGYIVPACSCGGYAYSDLVISGNGSNVIYANPESTGAFAGLCHYLSDELGGEFVNLSMLDTTYAINLSYMFSGVRLKSLDISHFNLPDAMTLDHMFYMSTIGSINFGRMDTWHIVNMSYMFALCGGMETLDLSNFDTTHLRYVNSMFESHRTTKVIDLSSFNTEYVLDFSYMFAGLKDAEYIDLSSFKTTDAESLAGMFKGMKIGMTELNLSSWDTSKVSDMRFMFEDTCLESVYLNFSTASAIRFDSMFGGSESRLKNIYENNIYSASGASSVSYMFPFSGNPGFSSFNDRDISVLRPESAGGAFKVNPYTA